jgi:RNA polymerase sigma factor (sigma-70 family)
MEPGNTLPNNENELIRLYANLAYSIANSYRNSRLPLEDLKQESLLGLLEAYKRYDPSHNAKFSTYAVFWIKKRLLAAISNEKRSSLGAEELDENSLEDTTDPSTNPQNTSKSASLNLPPGMPILEKQILILSFEQQLTIKEIAQNLGISNEKVKQHRQKALRRIKAGYI